jgi:endonuclease/exonuclease/phosphatase (EEP) superfamily protein YafD
MSISQRLGWTCVAISFLLHAFTVFCYTRQPDSFAAYTVLPFWFWGSIGVSLTLFACYYLRTPLSGIMAFIWAVTLLVGSDESTALRHQTIAPPQPGPPVAFQGKPVIRVISLNCAIFNFGDPSQDLARWQPDIVLLQDVLNHHVKTISQTLYQGHGNFRHRETNGIVTRWKIKREIYDPRQRNHQVTLVMHDGREIEVVNVHLLSAATDLRFWKKSAWQNHRDNRLKRERELGLVRKILMETTDFPETPTLFGGDFNVPAKDIVHQPLSKDFINAFNTVGTGWGNTYPRRLPILRIDHLYASRHFTPVRSRVVETRHSDHRMVVTDFLMPEIRRPDSKHPQ